MMKLLIPFNRKFILDESKVRMGFKTRFLNNLIGLVEVRLNCTVRVIKIGLTVESC